MNELESTLAQAAGGQMVPVGFAEKAMASLMQLHTELAEEKEKRVSLYRTLMEKEQTLAELAMYVRILEERLGLGGPITAPVQAASIPRPPAVPEVPKQQVSAKRAAPAEPVEPARSEEPSTSPAPRRAPAPASEGWKVW